MLVLYFLIQLFSISFASHEFYGGSVNISPTGIKNEYLVRYQQSWSKTYFQPLCTAVEKNNPAAPILTYQLYYLNATRNTTSYRELSAYTPLICFDFDDVGNTFSGAGKYLLNTTDKGEFWVGFENCCWGPLVGDPYASWLLYTKYNATPRLDNGELNSTPEPLTQHIVQLKNGCIHTLRILATDQDKDEVRCRLASGYAECGDVCNIADTLQLILDPTTCLLSVDTWSNGTNVAIGRYAVAIQIEDYYVNQSLSTDPLSSVALQFVIEVYNSSKACDKIPSFSTVVPADNSSVCVTVGMYTQRIYATSSYAVNMQLFYCFIYI